ncbi:unnamed protein product [Allacma fusca]|uniref:G-protein coupled receptors family 1 profile domain-containing protein n=1 Tax=Allacma fusca TaxID=39272 RepID=A0A8J2P541_9HEXA|nr:unnamed protein product [Allacma fusca]
MSDFNEDTATVYSAFSHIYKSGENGGNGSSQLSNSSWLHLSPEDELLFRFVVQGVGITTVGLVGIIGNIFSMMVLSKKRMRSPIGCFLFGLALADFIFVLMGGTLIGIPSFLSYFGGIGDFGIDKPSPSSLILLTPIFFGLAMTSQTASVYFTVAVTTERFIAICYPFKARRMLSLKRAVYMSLGVILFSILYNIPRWWEYDSLEVYDQVTGDFVGYKPIPSKLKNKIPYDVWYINVAYLVLMEVLPTVILCILNVKIYTRIRTANKTRQTLSSSQRHENSLAFMLLVIVAIFLLCNIFPLLERIIKTSLGSENIIEIEYVLLLLLSGPNQRGEILECLCFRRIWIRKTIQFSHFQHKNFTRSSHG